MDRAGIELNGVGYRWPSRPVVVDADMHPYPTDTTPECSLTVGFEGKLETVEWQVTTLLEELRPEAVVMMGEFSGRAMVTVERLAQNRSLNLSC